MIEDKPTSNKEVPDSCPHCGNKLSPWQQVLLATDRALVCKKCWYRIILDVIPGSKKTGPENSNQKEKN